MTPVWRKLHGQVFSCLAGGLEDAHRIVQDFDTPEARYWHGIVHRREPDYSNAKYWFRQLGHHAVFDDLRETATLKDSLSQKTIEYILPSGKWDPFRFVDLCDDCQKGGQSELLTELLIIQQKEIDLTFTILYSEGPWRFHEKMRDPSQYM